MINPNIAEHAYFIGFVQADGSLYEQSRNRGRLRIELSDVDVKILDKFSNMFDVKSTISNRVRDTNFLKNSKTVSLSFYDMSFRNELKSLGVFAGKKAKIIKPPDGILIRDYLRGLVDADGSVGTTAKGSPFISLTTSSEGIKTVFLNFEKTISGKSRVISRNKRDNVYNILILNENAQAVINELYYPGCLCLDRKWSGALRALSWKRPSEIKRIDRSTWTAEEDKVVLSVPMPEACQILGRSRSSISCRKTRLLNKNN